MTNSNFTILVFTENHVGLLSRITLIFSRRHINIESITVSESEIEGIHRFTIVIRSKEEQVQKLVKQIEKQVEVLKAFYHNDDDTIYQEIALFKISTSSLGQDENLESLIRENHARILNVSPDFIVIEKTGHEDETRALFEKLQPFGVLEFVRSGRVSITKATKAFSAYMEELDEANAYNNL